MIRYECEKRPGSASSCSPASGKEWYGPGMDRARRPLPPRPMPCDAVPAKTTVPLKVWIIASASCFAVCAVLVLATVVITQWGTVERYPTRGLVETPLNAEPIYAIPHPQLVIPKTTQSTTTTTTTTTTETEPPTTASSHSENEIQNPILEKLSIFKNIVGREKTKNTEDIGLASKPQLHPAHDTTLQHPERRIEKKDQALYPGQMRPYPKPIQTTIVPYVPGMRRQDDYYEEYYNDENLYEDYMQSNTMTSYLIEKVQELHDWITTDPDLEASGKEKTGDEFSQVLRALNDSLVAGDVSIVMGKLKEIYLGDGVALLNRSRKAIIGNGTDLFSFGILTLDVILLHNIQLMAWENQEAARVKMLKDPDVFAFNALFLEPGKVEAKRNEVYHHHDLASRHNRPETAEEFDFGKNLLENVLEIGMSTARAAIHLGRAYKNTKLVLAQLSNRDGQTQLPRVEGAAQVLGHLQTSYVHEGKGEVDVPYTDLDCIWTLYCKNLVATSALNAPYGTMAKINGLALRLLSGQLTVERALPAALHDALTGRADIPCAKMLPRCSKVNAAAVVMDSIILPTKKNQSSNRVR